MPLYIEEQLAQPPKGEGERYEEITALAWQLVGEGNPREEVFQILRTRYPKETTGKPDGEIYRAIDGAIAKGPKPAATSKRNGSASLHYSRGGSNDNGPSVKRLELAPVSETAEIPRLECSKLDFLNRV